MGKTISINNRISMKINICGDFTTVGKGYSAIEAGTAISDDIIALFKNSDFNILNLESPVITDNTKAIKNQVLIYIQLKRRYGI